MSRPVAAAVLPVALLAAPACDYGLIRPDAGGGSVVRVPTTSNDTGWFGLEVDMTEALRADLQRQLDVRLSGDSADYVLRTSIEDVTRRSRVGLRSGGAALGTADLVVRWTLEDAAGHELAGGDVRRQLEFLTDLDEDARDALAEVMNEISQQVVLDVAAWMSARNGA